MTNAVSKSRMRPGAKAALGGPHHFYGLHLAHKTTVCQCGTDAGKTQWRELSFVCAMVELLLGLIFNFSSSGRF